MSVHYNSGLRRTTRRIQNRFCDGPHKRFYLDCGWLYLVEDSRSILNYEILKPSSALFIVHALALGATESPISNLFMSPLAPSLSTDGGIG